MKTRSFFIFLFVFLATLVLVRNYYSPTSVIIVMQSPAGKHVDSVALYYDSGHGFNEAEVISSARECDGQLTFYNLKMPGRRIRKIRIDPGNVTGEYIIREISLEGVSSRHFGPEEIIQHFKPTGTVASLAIRDNYLSVVSDGADPGLQFIHVFRELQDSISRPNIFVLLCFAFALLLMLSPIILIVDSVRRSLHGTTRYIFSTGIIFVCSVIAAALTFDLINLPFSNPLNIVGPMALLRYNPNTDVVRFLYIILLPCLSVMLLSRFIKKSDHNADDSSTAGDGSPARAIVFVVFVCIAAIYVGNHYKYHDATPLLDTYHEGETLGAAVEHLNEKAPYRDTLFVHGVVADPLRSLLAFELFGRSISSSRIVASLLHISTTIMFIAAVFYIFNMNVYWSAIIVSMLMLIQSIRPFGFNAFTSARDLPVYLFVLLAVAIHRTIRNDRETTAAKQAILFLILSFFPVASIAYSIDRGVYLLLMEFILVALISARHFRVIRRNIWAMAIGSLLGVLVLGVSIDFCFREFLWRVFLYLPHAKDMTDGIRYEFLFAGYFVPVICISLSLFALTTRFFGHDRGSTPVFERIKEFMDRHLLELFLTSFSILLFRNALGRSDDYHIGYSSVFVILATYYTAYRCISPFAARSAYYESKKGILLPILAILFMAVSFLNYTPNIDWNNLYRFPVQVSDESLIPENYYKTIAFLRANVNDDDSFYAMTSEASWLYFLDRPCPTRYPVVWFGIAPFAQQEIIRDLQEKNVKFLLYENELWTCNIDNIPTEKKLPIIYNYIHDHYRPLETIDDQALWIRND